MSRRASARRRASEAELREREIEDAMRRPWLPLGDMNFRRWLTTSTVAEMLATADRWQRDGASPALCAALRQTLLDALDTLTNTEPMK